MPWQAHPVGTGGKKHRILCCYDYGIGGVWIYVFARTTEEIRTKYPELTVVEERPAWVTAGEEPDENMTFDIDRAPTGWLREIAP
jgi:hypothetical protein